MEYTNIYPPRRCGLGQGFLGVSYNNKQLLGWIGKVACEAEEGCKRADQLGFVESFVENGKIETILCLGKVFLYHLL